MEIEQLDRFTEFSKLIYSASKSLHSLKTLGMESYGLGSTHTFCLRALQGKQEGLTRTELATACLVDKAQISRVVVELTDMGYLMETSKGAGYRKKIVLSEKGKLVAKGIDEKVGLILEYVSGDIPDEEIVQLYRTLDRICENLKRAEEACVGVWDHTVSE